MAKYLVIVESPAKVKTIKKFLGSNYEVMASNGHVRDLPKSSLGIDVEHDYEPKYITIRGKGDILAALRKEVKKADRIYLATDPDREGEAISWHLKEALKLDSAKTSRITFNEITKDVVKASIKHPREINEDLVNAQQARRMLDRMVGYRISPLLWAKVKRGLSAGRVQSVALRMICDREAEIEAFIPDEYWTLEAELLMEGEKKPIKAQFYGTNGSKEELKSREDVDRILAAVEGAEFCVTDVKRGERQKKAPLPFTTSTLQQEASKMLNFSTSKTMRVAQQLYEGVDIKGRGTVGIITYLRTDSTRISEEAINASASFISESYGEKYLAQVPGKAAGSSLNVQDAHEAIRPTDIRLTPDMVKDQLTREQYRLYQLIWRRFTASRMSSAVYDTLNVKIEANGVLFTAATSRVGFDGFLAVYADEEEKLEKAPGLNRLEKGTVLQKEALEEKQHFTQPPAHYTEASLVKAMEEQGIGRPSTYAPTISTILARHYITKESRNLFVTDLGDVVNRIMVEQFPSIVDITFTANLESLLDMIGEGTVNWKTVVSNFYPDLDEAVKLAEKDLEKFKVKDEESDEICELCGSRMVIKNGPHGRFLACPNFPNCRNTKPYLEKIGVPCPLCGKDVVIKKTRKGRSYYGCSDNPNCEFMSWQRPSAEKCPKCGSYMVVRGNRLMCSKEGCGYVQSIPESEE